MDKRERLPTELPRLVSRTKVSHKGPWDGSQEWVSEVESWDRALISWEEEEVSWAVSSEELSLQV